MTEGESARPVIVWVAEGTWRACVDAALCLAPPGAHIRLLHVIPDEVPETAHGAYLGLFGRGGGPGRDPGPRVAELAAACAGELFDAADQRLARPCDRIERHGRPERDLRDCGLVDARPAGRASVYSLRQPALFSLLEAAEAVLAATGSAVALCPNYGQAP